MTVSTAVKRAAHELAAMSDFDERVKQTVAWADTERRDAFDENLGLVPSLARAVMDRYKFAKDSGGALYVYRGGVYSRGAEDAVRVELRDILEAWGKLKSWRATTGDDVAQYIADSHTPFLLDRPPLDLINVRNGLLDLRGHLNPHTANHYTSIQLPVRYDRDAKCPAWQRYLDSTFPRELHALVWEVIAWLITPDVSYQKAVLFTGAGGNGKSVLIDAISALLGADNLASKTLHQLEEDRFAPADLVGKLANVCADLPSQHLTSSSMFKAIVGGDQIDAQRKHKPPFTFRPYARLLFSANSFPRSSDATDGFFRRWLVVPFEKSFDGSTERRSKREWDEELQSPTELSGALNCALQALPFLRRRGEFSQPAAAREAAEQFRETTDPLAVWLSRRVEKVGDGRIPCKDLLFAFNE